MQHLAVMGVTNDGVGATRGGPQPCPGPVSPSLNIIRYNTYRYLRVRFITGVDTFER